MTIKKPVVKICCIQNRKEAEIAIRAGASAIGLVSEMPSGPGVISLEEIGEIASSVSPQVDAFLLTSKQSAEEIITQHKVCKTSTIQIVDDLPDEEYPKLRNTLPGITLVQVIHVKAEESIMKAKRAAEYADALLLDSGNPSLNIKELGGTGRTHNWSISRTIVQNVSVPVFLAGGLNPDNANQAIREVEPFGLDICSGLRTEGALNPRKVEHFMEAINRFPANPDSR